MGPEVSNNMSKCASLLPARWKSNTRRIAPWPCEARLAKALYGTHPARGVGVSCGRARVRRDGKGCWLTACARSRAAAPHNCIGGSEVNCLPSRAEASIMFADPSKMQNMAGVPPPSHWYKAPVEFM